MSWIIQKHLLTAALLAAFTAHAQTDPGVRGGPAGAGGSMAGLSTQDAKSFATGLGDFNEISSVTGSIAGTEEGLGPRFNLDNCGGCHAQPAIGGSSPAVNPQVAVATKQGATNTVPAFITASGPVREVRFKFNSDGSRDGGVHALFTITGRTDAPGCNLPQPDFTGAVASGNAIFRIPTPVFGAGLIEAIPDSTLLRNKGANASAKQALGISGHENRNGNDGTITRFGWKAQNKSLMIFGAEAYNVEQGVTNESFPQERDETAGCLFNGTPEDHTALGSNEISSGVVNFVSFMRFLAPPAPVSSFGAVSAASITAGSTLFNSNAVGCALCHTPALNTGASSAPTLSNKTANLFSDLLVHNMGPGLADDVAQGAAGLDEFRTAPLWGLGKRIFFLHDGRTSNLLDAIQAHSSPASSTFAASEANASVAAFNALTPAEKQNILNFLRSL